MTNLHYTQLTIQNPDGEIIYCKNENTNNDSSIIISLDNNINLNNTNTNNSNNIDLNINPSNLSGEEYSYIICNIIMIQIIIFMDIISDLNCENYNFIFYIDLIIDITGYYSASSFYSGMFLIYFIKYCIITIINIYLSYYCNFNYYYDYDIIINQNNNHNNDNNKIIYNCVLINITSIVNIFICIILYRFYFKIQKYYRIFNNFNY